MGCFLDAIKLSDLIKSVNAGGQTTVQAEDLALNDGCERKIVKELRELLPHVGVAVLAKALIVEAISKKSQARGTISKKRSKVEKIRL